MVVFAEPQDNPGCKILNKLKLMDFSRRGIVPNWGALKKPAKNKTINN